MRITLLSLLCTVLLLPGCATIWNDEYEPLWISSEPTGAAFTVGNHSGITPYNVQLERAQKDQPITWELDGYPKGEGVLVSRMDGAVYGNIVCGVAGLVGAFVCVLIDGANNDAWTYGTDQAHFNFYTHTARLTSLEASEAIEENEALAQDEW
jgi:hypothetical protein